MNENISRRAAVKLTLLGIVVTALVAVPTGVWASHHFNDVATNHPFHDEISAIAGAGIATGFGDGGFHPSDAVTRQAMAAFLERAVGRVGSVDGHLVTFTGVDAATLTGLQIDSGATGTGAGFVQLIGTAELSTETPAMCPCRVEIVLQDLDTGTAYGSNMVNIPNVGDESGRAYVSGAVHGVAPIPANSTLRIGIRAFLNDAGTTIRAYGAITASYLPLGPDGNNTLIYCSAQEDEPNGSFIQAKFLDGDPMYACIEPANDLDVFAIVVPGGQAITAETTGHGGPGTCEMDTLLRIRNSGGTEIVFDDDSGPSVCSRAVTGALPAGTYYIEVTGYDATELGTYGLTAAVAAPGSGAPDRYEPDPGDKD